MTVMQGADNQSQFSKPFDAMSSAESTQMKRVDGNTNVFDDVTSQGTYMGKANDNSNFYGNDNQSDTSYMQKVDD